MNGAKRDAIPNWQIEGFRAFFEFVASNVESDYRAKCGLKENENIILFHKPVSDEVCTKIIETLEDRKRTVPVDYFPSSVKQGGYFCFWVRKLKPYYISPKYTNKSPLTMSIYLNEICAWFGGIWLMEIVEKKRMINTVEAGMLNEILPDLRYHSMSPTAVVLMYQAFTRKI
jgi:hypothetical protein